MSSLQQDRSYSLLLEPSHTIVDADTARPVRVSEFSNDKFSLVIHATVDQTVTVTTSGPHTRIDMVDAVAQSNAASAIQEEARSSKRRRLERPIGALDETSSDSGMGAEPQRLANEIRLTPEEHERSSDSTPQSHDPETSLEVSGMENKKPTVHVGHGFAHNPGNVKYRDLIEARQAEYLRSDDDAKRQSIVDDIANRFNFQQDGVPVDDAWIQEKIQKALRDKRRLGKQRTNEDKEDDDSQYGVPAHVAKSYSSTFQRSTVAGNSRQSAGTAHQKDGSSYSASQSDGPESSLEVTLAENKPTVHFGRRFQHEPGNVKYRKLLLARKREYFGSDDASRSLIVDDIARRFNFLHEGLSVDATRIQQKIHKAIGDHRLGGKRKRGIGEKSEQWLLCQSSAIDVAKMNSATSTMCSVTMDEQPEPTEGNEQRILHALASASTSMTCGSASPSTEKPTVYIGYGFRNTPGNVAFRKAILAKQDDYHNFDAARQQLVVDDIARQFNFQEDGVVASTSLVHEKIRKALVDRRLGGSKEATTASFEPQLQEPRLAKKAMATKKMIVYCGTTKKHPGHVAYMNRVSSFQAEFRTSGIARQEAIVDSFLQLFDFQQSVDAMKTWQPASEEWVRNKIKKAFREMRCISVADPSRVDRNKSSTTDSFALEPRPPMPNRNKPLATNSGVKHATAKKTAATEKMIVYCGITTSHDPGNVAYINRISLFQREYRAADSARQEAIVDSFLQMFEFQRPSGAKMKSWQLASEVWARGKIKKAFKETRCGVGKQNAKLQSVALVDRNNSATTDSFASPHQPTPGQNLDMHEQLSMDKPIVYCGLPSWRDSPGNAMYWESLTTAHKMHTAADNELRVAMINSLMEQYEFQRRVSVEQDIWRRADDEWVRSKITKSFEVLDRRQE
jgi:hypothetical protein